MLCLPRVPKCAACPVRKWCATRGEAPCRTPRPRQNKKEIWYSLEERAYNSNIDISAAAIDQGCAREIRLVQRPKKTTLMPEMWELPQLSEPAKRVLSLAHWRTFRHSITTTDYTVHVLRGFPTSERVAETFSTTTGNSGEWIATHRIREIPITGLAQKILKAASII
jgi:adenine-specific DNA glycosylase